MGVGGVLSCVVDHILREFNTLFLTRFRTYKIAKPCAATVSLKVVGNEKEGGSERCQTFTICL